MNISKGIFIFGDEDTHEVDFAILDHFPAQEEVVYVVCQQLGVTSDEVKINEWGRDQYFSGHVDGGLVFFKISILDLNFNFSLTRRDT